MANAPQINQTQVDALVSSPIEGLNVEVKTWLDPDDDREAAKIIKALFALRNRNGGFLVIGFDDKTLNQDTYSFSKSPTEFYNIDQLQGIVSRYANDPFEIKIGFGERDGTIHPVILVPPGIQVPVVVKSDLLVSGRKVLCEADLYFRTLLANGTPSSAKIKPNDYNDLLDICFDNREADIGRFIRRQLGGTDRATLRKLLFEGEQASPPSVQPGPMAFIPEVSVSSSGVMSLKQRAEQILALGGRAFDRAEEDNPLSSENKRYLTFLTLEVAMVVEPEHADALPTREFLRSFWSANPQYTGWPAWMDTSSFTNPQHHPRVIDNAWVTFMAELDGRLMRNRLEFMLYDPKGNFYTRRLMQDDTNENVRAGELLDPILMLYRVTEFIAAGLSAISGAGWEDDTKVGFAFRWTNLSGRKLSSWANPMRFISIGEGRECHSQESSSYVEVGVDTPHSALAPSVAQATAHLFSCFDGYQPPSSVVEEAVKALIERRL